MPYRPKPKPTLEHLRLDQITWDPEVQPREGEPPAEILEEYTKRYKDGLPMGPVEVVNDGETDWGFDGFTRRIAAARAGLSVLPAYVYQGTREDAMRWASSANAEQRQPWTREMKARRLRKVILRYPADTDADLATECDVHHNTVRAARKTMAEEMLKGDASLASEELLALLGIRPDDLAHVRDCLVASIPVPAAIPTKPKAPKAQKPAAPPAEAEDEPADELCRAHDAQSRRLEKAKKKDEAARKPDLKDGTGAIVPEILRDLFASTALADLAADLAALLPLAQQCAKLADAIDLKEWSGRVPALAPAYPHLEYAKLLACLHQSKNAIRETAALLQRELAHAAEYATSAAPYAVCPACNGDNLGKEECACSGAGYLPSYLHHLMNRQGA